MFVKLCSPRCLTCDYSLCTTQKANACLRARARDPKLGRHFIYSRIGTFHGALTIKGGWVLGSQRLGLPYTSEYETFDGRSNGRRPFFVVLLSSSPPPPAKLNCATFVLRGHPRLRTVPYFPVGIVQLSAECFQDTSSRAAARSEILVPAVRSGIRCNVAAAAEVSRVCGRQKRAVKVKLRPKLGTSRISGYLKLSRFSSKSSLLETKGRLHLP